MNIRPPNRPRLNRQDAEAILAQHGDTEHQSAVMLLSMRSYYSKMGAAAGNDVGIYDDASVVISPQKFATFNFNTDASKLGWNPAVGKPFGLLQPGKWYFHKGLHRGQYKALRQFNNAVEAASKNCPTAGAMTVLRCWAHGDRRNYLQTGWYNINDHSGNNGTTSSWLCQTTPPDQYWERYNMISGLMNDHNQGVIACRLVEG